MERRRCMLRKYPHGLWPSGKGRHGSKGMGSHCTVEIKNLTGWYFNHGNMEWAAERKQQGQDCFSWKHFGIWSNFWASTQRYLIVKRELVFKDSTITPPFIHCLTQWCVVEYLLGDMQSSGPGEAETTKADFDHWVLLTQMTVYQIKH